jgi:hypothetical protein
MPTDADFRHGAPAREERVVAAEALCDGLIREIAKKASHNKNEALCCFMLAVACTTTVPLFITLGEGFYWAKLVPSCLSVLATGATAWLQLRKPQQLWALYRTAQRELEDHRTRYTHQLDAYADAVERHKILAENAADIAIELHYDWLPVVPTVQQLTQTDTQTKERRRRRNKP